MTSALEISHVDQMFHAGFWLKRAQVLYDINLKVPEHTIFGFLGANGAGKTTLINLIIGIRRPTHGTIKVFGFSSDSLEAKSHVGFLPERPYFYQHLTGEGLLKYFGSLGGMARKQVVSQIPKVLSAVGLSHARNIELKNYSKGMLQRIGIAQALIHDPQFLVLDEPMSGLDPLGRNEIRELILMMAKEGRTVFFSSHIVPDVEAICDQIGLIENGRLVASGPIAKFLSDNKNQIEIGFRCAKPFYKDDWPEFEVIRSIPEGFSGLVRATESVNRVLIKLIQDGASVQWVAPVHLSLEDLFKKKVSLAHGKFSEK